MASTIWEPMMTISSARPNEQLLLTSRQAAQALQISERKLWSMKASGEIPHVLLGRSVRYPVADLQQWIDERMRGGGR